MTTSWCSGTQHWQSLPLRPDLPLLRKGLEWIEAQAARPPREREWFQGAWRAAGKQCRRSCNTAYCLAGYICEITGGQWVSDDPTDPGFDKLRWEPGDPLYEGHPVWATVSARAQRKLGLDYQTACSLFQSGLSARQLHRTIEQVFVEAGEQL